MKRAGLDRMRHFVTFVNGLDALHDFDQLGAKLRIHADPTGLEARFEGPDEHRLRSYLIDARKLLLEREDVALATAIADCLDRIHEPVARQAVVDAAAHWEQRKLAGEPRVVIDGAVLAPAQAADIYLYGHVFHEDLAKEVRLMAFRSNPINDALFMDAVLSYIHRVIEIAVWIASVIKHEDEAGRLA